MDQHLALLYVCSYCTKCNLFSRYLVRHCCVNHFFAMTVIMLLLLLNFIVSEMYITRMFLRWY